MAYKGPDQRTKSPGSNFPASNDTAKAAASAAAAYALQRDVNEQTTGIFTEHVTPTPGSVARSKTATTDRKARRRKLDELRLGPRTEANYASRVKFLRAQGLDVDFDRTNLQLAERMWVNYGVTRLQSQNKRLRRKGDAVGVDHMPLGKLGDVTGDTPGKAVASASATGLDGTVTAMPSDTSTDIPGGYDESADGGTFDAELPYVGQNIKPAAMSEKFAAGIYDSQEITANEQIQSALSRRTNRRRQTKKGGKASRKFLEGVGVLNAAADQAAIEGLAESGGEPGSRESNAAATARASLEGRAGTSRGLQSGLETFMRLNNKNTLRQVTGREDANIQGTRDTLSGIQNARAMFQADKQMELLGLRNAGRQQNFQNEIAADVQNVARERLGLSKAEFNFTTTPRPPTAAEQAAAQISENDLTKSNIETRQLEESYNKSQGTSWPDADWAAITSDINTEISNMVDTLKYEAEQAGEAVDGVDLASRLLTRITATLRGNLGPSTSQETMAQDEALIQWQVRQHMEGLIADYSLPVVVDANGMIVRKDPDANAGFGKSN